MSLGGLSRDLLLQHFIICKEIFQTNQLIP